MDHSVQVGGHVSKWAYGLRIVGPFALGFSLLLTWQGFPVGGIALGIAAVVWHAALEAYILNRYLRRRYVCDARRGFIFRDRHGERSYTDDQVAAFALYYRDYFSQGVLKSQTRYFDIWIDDDPNPLRIENHLQLSEPDPLLDFLQRIMDHLAARSEKTLESGGQVEGERWSLTSGELTIQRGKMPEPILVRYLAAADVFEQRLCVWRRDEEMPVVRIPIASRNAHLLSLLLSSRVKQPDAKEAILSGSLGRILFERRMGTSHWAMAICLNAISLFLLFGATFFWEGDGQLFTLIIGVVLFAGSSVRIWDLFLERFRCHEFGVHRSNLFGRRNLYYRDVQSFTYHATRHLVNGAYSHTSLHMRFQPHPEVNAPAIKYSVNFKNVDADLDSLRDHISGIIATKMAERLDEGHFVVWTANLIFHPEGLEFRRKAMMGRKASQRLPYEAIQGFDLQDGVFWLWEKGTDKPVMQESVAEANFFPGFWLLVQMLAPPEESKQ